MNKKNILKEAGVLLIGAILICSSVSAMANTNDITIIQTTGMKIKTIKSNVGLGSSGNVLWDNFVENFSGIIAAQHEPLGTPNRLDAFPADDFMFDENTDVHRVFWGGGYFQCNYAQGPKDYHFDWNITFFEDDGSGDNPDDIYAGPFTILDADIVKSEEYVNDSLVSNGAWGVAYWAWLPDPVTFNADTKYWISIYGIDETFPQSCLGLHDEPLGGILLHEAKFKSEYFGHFNWTNISEVLGEEERLDLNFALLGPDPDFEVTISKGLGITANIKNQGLLDATIVSATITATGGLVLGRTKTVSVGDIPIGDTGSAKAFLIGIGSIAIEVKVTCFEGMTGYGDTNGFLLLIFIL